MLYIIRHGKTEWNEIHRLQGRTDIPLNEDGINMAQAACEEYKDIHFDICYCSPLIRAKQTAELLLSGRNIPVVYDDRLKEMCFGEYEGMQKVLHIPNCPLIPLFKDPAKYIAPEGCESLEELFERTGQFLEETVYPQLNEGKSILIVGHGAMNSAITCQVLGIPVDKFWDAGIENCKLKQLK